MKFNRKQLLAIALMNFTTLSAYQAPFSEPLDEKPYGILAYRLKRSDNYPATLMMTLKTPLKSQAFKNVSSPKVKTRDWGNRYAKVSQVFKQVSDDRADLNHLRSRHITAFQKAYDTGSVDTRAITRNITNDTINYLNRRVEEEVAKLGRAPCKFSIFTMGSMARQETGFITDLEIGFLVEKNDFRAQKYFTRLSQHLSDRLFLLGEHPCVGGKGLRIDEADNAPIHHKFFARHADPEWAKILMNEALAKRQRDAMPFEGSRPYIATPEEFAMYFHPNALKKHTLYDRKAYKRQRDNLVDKNFKIQRKLRYNNMKANVELYEEVRHWVEASMKPFSPREQSVAKSVANLGRNIAYIFGDRDIYETFMRGRDKVLKGPSKNKHTHYTSRRQEIAFTKMLDENAKYLEDPNNFIMTGKLGETIDLKRQLYRYCEQVFTTLGFYYDLGTQNTIKITERLIENHIMAPQFGTDVIDLLHFVTVLRLKEQAILKKQGWEIYLDESKFVKDKTDLEQSLAGLQNVRTFFKAAGVSQSELESVEAKIREKQHDLDELKHVAPGAILSKVEQDALELKYIPIIQRLYASMTSWLLGNKNAFWDTKHHY